MNISYKTNAEITKWWFIMSHKTETENFKHIEHTTAIEISLFSKHRHNEKFKSK